MHVVVINKDQQHFVEPMRKALAPVEPLFVFDRCTPVEKCKYIHNTDGRGFLAGLMRDLGAEGVDDDILFLDGDKVPMGDIVADIESLCDKYDCIFYGVSPENEASRYRAHMKENDTDGIVPFQMQNFLYAWGCYSCGMWVSKGAVRKLRKLNGGRVFHPAFDGVWGDEDNFLADELHYSGFRLGYSTHVRLSGRFSTIEDERKIEGLAENFVKRIKLRKNFFNAEA